ncbi:MAG: zinc ribbon domain-containing protein [Candidatus Omnitrophota bacterium]
MAEYICPHCKKPIYDDDALLCLYCGESLRRNIGFMGKIKYPSPKIIVTIIVLLVLLTFIILVIR